MENVVDLRPAQADATSPQDPPAAGAPYPTEAPREQIARQLTAALHNLRTAARRLTQDVPAGTVAHNELRAFMNTYCELQETGVQLGKRIGQMGTQQGEAMGIGRQITKLQTDVGAFVQSVEGALTGAASPNAQIALGAAPAAPQKAPAGGVGIPNALWWFGGALAAGGLAFLAWRTWGPGVRAR